MVRRRISQEVFFKNSYDTYTPTQNIVYHDFQNQNLEWFKRQRDRFRKGSIERVKTALQIPGGDPSETALANLGIFGVGKRRTLQQLMDFAGIDLNQKVNNNGSGCIDTELVTYDASISPVENLNVNPDNLDPQPEYPLRTALTYYQQVEKAIPALDLELDENSSEVVHPDSFVHQTISSGQEVSLPPVPLLLLLWAFGLIVWYIMFIANTSQTARSRKKHALAHKDV